MGIGKIDNLRDVRERLLGYRLGSVARLTGISPERLGAIESGKDSPTVFEAEELSRVYGIDADLLASRPLRLAPKDVVEVFASLDEFRVVGDVQKALIIEATNAARDLRELELIAGVQPDAQGVPAIHFHCSDPPYRQGGEIAAALRQKLALTTGPIASLRDMFRDHFHKLTLLYAELGRDGPAGVALADRRRPPTIILNLDGKNENPCVRRFSLAHELCHLVTDWKRGEPLGILSGYYSETALDRERRANAFAVRFLCPEADLTELPSDPMDAAKALMLTYGMHYSAARLYLHNEKKDNSLPSLAPASLTLFAAADRKWEEAEAPHGIFDFPIPKVPTERRTRVAALAAYLYSEGRIARDKFAEMLRLTPADEVEKVLDFFDLSQPGDGLIEAL
ncbi:MAG: XRE family transcriptional regulator [Candidatus Binatus sp.]|uniref:ImmA/IrrE family metallo-endopeptidase n=1 Tax=Candidatus Binatus sp. TaxID=2811406 RepID=UPI003C73D015